MFNKHPRAMVALQATGLLAVLFGCLYRLYQTPNTPLAIYIALWAVFHLCEYYVTKTYLPRTATQWLFLLFGAVGMGNLFAVHCISLTEHALTQRFWRYHGFPVLGLALAGAGIVVRALAIKHCGNSFSHYIEPDRPQELVTHGIYAWCRHPSYLGFILYTMGMQTILGNLVVYAMSMVILFRFFLSRIYMEEIVLVENLYPGQYEKYQERVPALVPFVNW